MAIELTQTTDAIRKQIRDSLGALGVSGNNSFSLSGDITITGNYLSGTKNLLEIFALSVSTSVGSLGIKTLSSFNVFIGDVTTGNSILSANHNFAFGSGAGCSLTTGFDNIFIGDAAGRSNTTGAFNNFLGNHAGCSNTTGSFNNFFGDLAGRDNTTGYQNNFFGAGAGRANTTGAANNFIGRYTGHINESGSLNNFFGNVAGFSNTTGSANNFLGNYAGRNNTTGNFNNFLGNCAGCSNTIGSNNIVIGNRANVATNSLSGVIVLGHQAIATESNQFVLSTTNVVLRNFGNTFNIGSPDLTNNLTIFGNLSTVNTYTRSLSVGDLIADNIPVSVISLSSTKFFVSSETNKIYHFDTTVQSLCAVFPSSLPNGFSVAVMNTGTNLLRLSAEQLNSIGETIAVTYGGAFIYKDNNQLFAVGRL